MLCFLCNLGSGVLLLTSLTTFVNREGDVKCLNENILYVSSRVLIFHLRKVEHKRLFNLLSFAARKNILLFWINDAAPCKKSWHNIIMDFIPCEYITCMLHSKLDTFYKIWDPYLTHIGPTLSAAVLGGFPSRS